ncbi:MAG: HPr(Ser) kinase/phosphatase [Clostridiales bacterium]|uniref:HPr kinase/phosphorylase n=1 Tax=Harryflintia acetispora TaxID=1849041 RepID=A0A9X8ULN7_9FIRM|nr:MULTISPECIES: HPr(Ser) kinase/phosphatase [Oscillospiraceae]PWM39268.1 MAG: HPr(Ser) kinase/phosphatase [Clostridiales bacterium]RGB69816.1 HPr(Ser) kinase/phosphatase [Harryflintia acetispora]TCL44656.1 Hpr(Ser) kinase/phosphatase [Harryflintia acetispora]
MSITYSVSLEKLMKEFGLQVFYIPCEPKDIAITSADVNRPGLQLSGFFDFFDRSRIQIIGKSEIAYLEQIGKERLRESCDKFFSYKPPVVIVSRALDAFPEMIEAAKKYEVPLLGVNEGTSAFMSGLISILNVELAPRQTCHGVLVEVYGEGILLLGESGVGKSETAIELVKRGHRLIADDAVEIRRVSNRTLVGTSPENIRHFVELRGVGIINARRIFGMGAVKMTEKIDMIIQLEPWDKKKVYDRMGMESEYTEILGISVTSTTIPVKPGRNLAIIIEVAAMNNRQKKMGYNAAQELLEKVGMADPEDSTDVSMWDAF